jgi:hypothetical protein
MRDLARQMLLTAQKYVNVGKKPPGFHSFTNKYLEEYEKIFRNWRERTFFPMTLEDVQADLLASYARDFFVYSFSWAIPSDEAIDLIASYDNIIDAGAGTGYWAGLLRQQGCKVEAWDKQPYFNGYCNTSWSYVERVAPAEVLYRLSSRCNHTLLLVWPPVNSFAYKAVKAFSGNRVIYVGEWYGCTGDADFHNYLEDYFEVVNVLEIPRWPCILDRLYVLERK